MTTHDNDLSLSDVARMASRSCDAIARIDGRLDNVADATAKHRERIDRLEAAHVYDAKRHNELAARVDAAGMNAEVRAELTARLIDETADKTATRLGQQRSEIQRAHKLIAEPENCVESRLLGFDSRGVLKRLDSAEQNLADHERQIGGWDSREATITEAIAGIETILAGMMARIRAVEDRKPAVFANVGGQIADIGERLAALERKIALCAPAFPPDKEAFDRRLATLERRFDDDRKRRKRLANGPRSFDKRIAALEARPATLELAPDDGCDCEVVADCDGSCMAAEKAMFDAMYGEEPIKRQATGDTESIEDESLPPLAGFLRAEYGRCLSAGMTRIEAVNRVGLRAKQIEVEAARVACEIAGENL